MHCSQVSSGASQAYAMHAAQGRKATGCGEAKPAKSSEACGESSGGDDAPRAARAEGRPARNPLVAAMMEAFKGLVPDSASVATSPTAQAADTADAGSTESASKDQAKALKEAAYGFAHELFQALKSVGSSGAEASGESGGCRPHRCGGYGKEAGGASAYGGLAQGLQRLAQSFAPAVATPAVPAGSTASTTGAEAATTPSTASDTSTPQAIADAAPVDPAPAKTAELTTIKTPAPASSATNITINFTLNFGTAAGSGTSGTGAAQQDESPLLAAFKKLMLALNPPKDGAAAGAAEAPAGAADAKKPEEMLKAFLQQIAKALGADASTAGDALPAKGSLVNLTA